MKSSTLYRIAAVLLVVFAAAHQFGFRSVDPSWNAADVVRGMQTTRFAVQGFTRSYWDFFSGFGFFVTIFLLFSAVLSWEIGRQPAEVLRAMTRTRWTFAACYVVITVMTWAFFFVAPGVFATAITLCLILGAMKA